MKKLFLLSLVSLFFVFTSCDKKIKDFENIIEVTPDDCQKWDLADVHFIISHPTDDHLYIKKAKEGNHNMSYVMIDYLTDEDLCNEEISLGYCDKCATSSSERLSELLSQLGDQFESQLPNFEVVSIDEEKVFGEKRNILKFKFSGEETILNYFEAGDYLGIIVLISDDSANGVTLIMLGNENSGIKDYSDFGDKGHLGDIWKTFRFVK